MGAGLDVWGTWGGAMLSVCARQGSSARDAALLLLSAGAQLPVYEEGDGRQALMNALLWDDRLVVPAVVASSAY